MTSSSTAVQAYLRPPLTTSWHDHRLTWNPEEFDNRTFLHLHEREMWSPNLDVINAPPRWNSGYDDRLLTGKIAGLIPATVVCTIRVVTLDTHESSEVALVEGKDVWDQMQEDENTEWIMTDISYGNYTEYNRRVQHYKHF
ncbi:hypothetical protein HPB51_026626 [Rhipicephalus microplus]|uniref:Neurotransmitter-gated ion-channel ligand-binding domain-containing protein n=1 Tax=Rhipicephalus microplus TaxID=6941 RepID=A0A9J6D2M4_RHIMP|nr:hypothetical protein HPB51_026626 [Rhipicephalus microplus]